MKLLADSKNERLSHLLEQTDSYLNQIGVLVHQQQREREKEKEAAGQTVMKPLKGTFEISYLTHSLKMRRQMRVNLIITQMFIELLRR